MNFQKQINRRVEVEKKEETKYYEEIYRKRTMELLGINNDNIYGTARGVYNLTYSKTIFLTSNTSSGKSYVVRRTTGGLGMKIVNSDDIYEKDVEGCWTRGNTRGYLF